MEIEKYINTIRTMSIIMAILAFLSVMFYLLLSFGYAEISTSIDQRGGFESINAINSATNELDVPLDLNNGDVKSLTGDDDVVTAKDTTAAIYSSILFGLSIFNLVLLFLSLVSLVFSILNAIFVSKPARFKAAKVFGICNIVLSVLIFNIFNLVLSIIVFVKMKKLMN